MSYVYVVYKAMDWMACKVDRSVPMKIRDVVMHETHHLCFNREEVEMVTGRSNFVVLKWGAAPKKYCEGCSAKWASPCPGCWDDDTGGAE